MSALDDLLGEFEANAGKMPQVNPPEATKVLAAQTAPEVAGKPEPVVVEQAPPAPTAKPADVIQAEQAKTRKPRGQGKASATQAAVNAQAAPPEGWDNVPATAEDGRSDILAALKLLAGVLPPNVKIEIIGKQP